MPVRRRFGVRLDREEHLETAAARFLRDSQTDAIGHLAAVIDRDAVRLSLAGLDGSRDRAGHKLTRLLHHEMPDHGPDGHTMLGGPIADSVEDAVPDRLGLERDCDLDHDLLPADDNDRLCRGSSIDVSDDRRSLL